MECEEVKYCYQVGPFSSSKALLLGYVATVIGHDIVVSGSAHDMRVVGLSPLSDDHRCVEQA